jgi:hypothetical protein
VDRRTITAALDVLTLLLAAGAVAITICGGIDLSLPHLRLTASNPFRTLLLLGGVILLRATLFQAIGPFGRQDTTWRRMLAPASDHPMAAGMAPGQLRRTLLAALGLAAALALLLHEQLQHPYSIADLGDPLFSIWRMGWVQHALAADPQHLFDGNIFHPLPLALTFSDAIILPAMAGAPLRALGLHPLLVYNLLFVGAMWLSGVGTYLLVERLTGSPRAAFVSGLLYAACAYRFEHYSHLELQMTQWMPLGLLALHLFAATGRWPYAAALAAAGLAQLYSGMYYAVFFLVYVIAVGLGLWLVHRPSLRALAVPLLVSAIGAGILASPLIRAFSAAEVIKGERSLDEIVFYSAKPVDYLRANTRSVTWREHLLPPLPERALFPGAVPLALAAVALIPPLSPMRVVYAVALAVVVDGSFGLHGVIYPQLYHYVGVFHGLRSPARFAALVALTLAVLAGFGVARLLRGRSTRTCNLALAALIVAILVDAWPALQIIPTWTSPPNVYDQLPAQSNVVLAEFPFSSDPAFNAVYMYFSLWHWRPMVNGYSGFIPQPYTEVAPDIEEFPLGRSLVALRDRGVTHVTINCGIRFISNDDCETIIARAARAPELHLLAETRWEDARVLLYAFEPGS